MDGSAVVPELRGAGVLRLALLLAASACGGHPPLGRAVCLGDEVVRVNVDDWIVGPFTAEVQNGSPL